MSLRKSKKVKQLLDSFPETSSKVKSSKETADNTFKDYTDEKVTKKSKKKKVKNAGYSTSELDLNAIKSTDIEIDNERDVLFKNGMLNPQSKIEHEHASKFKDEHLENGLNVIKMECIDIKAEDDHIEDEVLKHLLEKKEISMPQEHLIEMIRRIEILIPENDTLTYRSRTEKLNWDDVAFNTYSVADCKETWGILQKKIRRYRILKEVLDDARQYVINPTSIRGKKRRHPDMPQKSLSHYMIFYKKKKSQILAENPGIDFGELSHRISLLFKNLPPEKKLKYEKLAAQSKAEYEMKLHEFYNAHPELMPPAKIKKEKVKPPPKHVEVKPKKPHTPFSLYVEGQLKKQVNVVETDKNAFRERCKEQWKQLSDKKKVYWINWAEDEVAKYEEEAKVYMEDHPDYVPITVKHIITKEEKLLKERLLGKPLKPPNSAYSLFSRMMLQSEEIKKINAKDRMNFISNQWKSCAEEERTKYKHKAQEMMEKYKLDYEKYVESLPEDKRQLELEKNVPKRKKTESEVTPKRSKKRKPESSAKKSIRIEEPKTPPISAYKYFVSVFKNETKSPKLAWKEMSATERSLYERELVRVKQEYILEFEKFLNSLSKEELEQYSRSKQLEAKRNNGANEGEEDSSTASSSEEESNDEGNSDDE